MIAQLSELSQAASPTPFHQVLRLLDERGGLLRVYTQNIDAIESKCGLSFGVPAFEDKRCKPRSMVKTSAASPASPLVDGPSSLRRPPTSQGSSRHTSPATEIPRCIPLHGTLQTLHCQTCTHTFPLEDYVDLLTSGMPPCCPECAQMEQTRQLVGKRARGVGKLRPSVVLYNEMHKDGEGVGETVRRDLVGSSKGKGRSGADVLLVVGTSLRVPGTKRIVREFSKAVRSRGSFPKTGTPSIDSYSPLSSPSSRRHSRLKEGPPMKSIYLNFDYPVPTREWEGVFDAWVQGDAQTFAQMLIDEITKEAETKQIIHQRRRKRGGFASGAEEAESATNRECPSVKRQKVVKTSGMGLSAQRSLGRQLRGRALGDLSPRSSRGTNTPIKLTPAQAVKSKLPSSESSKLIIRFTETQRRRALLHMPVREHLHIPLTPTHCKRSLAGQQLGNEVNPPDHLVSDQTDKSDSSDISDVEAEGELPRVLPHKLVHHR